MEFSAAGGKLKLLAKQETARRRTENHCGDELKVSARIIREILGCSR